MRFALRCSIALAMLTGVAPVAPAGIGSPGAVLDSIAYTTRVADLNLVGATLTNYGAFGNNFSSLSPSLEYPLGTGYEHLPRGGLWIGAHVADSAGVFGDYIRVTTACVDGAMGTSLAAGSEFTPAGLDFVLRSRMAASPYFDPAALSDLDYLCAFSDRPAKTTTGNPESHFPLNVLVRQSTFSWLSGSLVDLLVLRSVIINLGSPLTNAWVGLYTELASGPKNAYGCWPPSSGCSSIGGWFQKAWVVYEDSLRLVREHYCAGQPVPAGCVLTRAPAWMGVELLTPPAAGQHVTLAVWNFALGDAARDQDVERYAIMSAGTIQDPSQPQFLPGVGDPIELLAIGPFAEIDPGDSVTVDFALVGGAGIPEIEAHARIAQRLHDAGYDETTPTQLSLVSAQATSDAVRVIWYSAPGVALATIERRDERNDWQPVARLGADGSGLITFEDHDVAPGARYGYRVSLGDRRLGEVWVDVPRAPEFALTGVRPNPAADGPIVAFSLPDAAPARLELMDLAGRRVLAREVGTLGRGSHVVNLADGRVLPAGVYLVRLTQGRRLLTARAVIIR